MAYGLQTYSDVFRHEDLLDILKDISPDETPLKELLQKDRSEFKRRAEIFKRCLTNTLARNVEPDSFPLY